MNGYVTFRPKSAKLHWTPVNKTADILRSEAPHDGFEVIDTIDLSNGEYIDQFKQTDSRYFYYKIDDFLLHMFQIPNEYAKEIVRRDRWFLKSERYSGGTYGFAFIKKTHAEHCPDCWDEVNEKATRSNCPTCYGTGYKDPYHKPLKLYVDFRGDQIHRRPSRDRISTEGYSQAFWTTNIPLFKPNDLFVFKGIRYRVVSGINLSRMGMYVTKQFVPLEAIESHRPEYKVPLPEEEVDFDVE